jgi:hypothetical protein
MTDCEIDLSLNGLLENFQQALRALVPMANQIKIGWKNEEAYDDWEDIESSLYQSLVINQITFDRNMWSFRKFAPYNMHLENLANYSIIQHQDLDGTWVFIGFRTEINPFDSCRLEKFDSGTLDTSCAVKQLSLEELRPEAVIRPIG